MKNTKKLDVIVKYFYPVTAGIETNIDKTYKILAKMGWDITIHTSKDTLTEKNILKDNEIIDDLKVKRYRWGKFGFLPKINEKTDLIALHNFNIFPHLQILIYSSFLKLLGKKSFALVLTPHGGFTPEWSVFPKITRFIKRIYHRTLGSLLINLCVDEVRAVSEWEKEQICLNGVDSKKLVVITNGVEDEAYLDVEKMASKDIKQKVASFGKYIIQIGRIYPIKNYETTIQALSYVPDIHYVIAGPLDYVMGKAVYKDQLDKLISNLGLEKRVHFVGVVKGVDKYYLLKKAQMMVHMAIWESFCNVVHEGLSQGLVCIVANNTALPYLIKDGINGYCVETKNSKAVAQKINFVLKNKNSSQIKNMEMLNRKYGLENSWQAVAKKVNQLYNGFNNL